MSYTAVKVETEERLEHVTFGMWLFIGSEVMFFAAFFAMYIIMRNAHPTLAHEHQHHLNLVVASINTFLLLISSLFMTNAVNASKAGEGKKVASNLVITALFGIAFLALKMVEYTGEIKEKLLPSTDLFFSCYYTMTGFHGLHIFIGVGALLILAWRANRGDFTKTYNSPIEVCGLYWCLVEVVWFFLFPILYLF
jgi:cytochrome c oxidase subunit III